MNLLSDKDLILNTLDEYPYEQNSFTELVNRYKHYVFTICYSKLKNIEDAEDAVQETFVRAYFGLKNFRFDSEFKTWLTQISINVALTVLLSKKKTFWRSFVTLDGDIDMDNIYRTTVGEESEKEFWNVVGSILRKMIQIYRKVFILKYFKNLAIRDIGSSIQLTVAATKMKVKRAKDQFIKILFGE